MSKIFKLPLKAILVAFCCLTVSASFVYAEEDETDSERKSTVSEERNTEIINSFVRGRAEYHTGNDANNCWNIFRHNSPSGFNIPAARLTRVADFNQKQENALTTSGFLKLRQDTLDGALQVALYMHAGSEGALIIYNETLAHIVNLYMDNDRVLHLRDFGMDADREDQIHNSYNWTHAQLFVNNFPGKKNPGNADKIGPTISDDDIADDIGRFSPKLQTMLNYSPDK